METRSGLASAITLDIYDEPELPIFFDMFFIRVIWGWVLKSKESEVTFF